MKNLFNVLGSIFIASTIVSCSGDSEETKSEITKNEVKEISVHKIDGTYDSEIIRHTFSSIASSYTTNRIPDSEHIGINNITITEKIICNAVNSNICDEFFKFFNNATEYNFIAKEEYAQVVEGRKNILKIKGVLIGGESKANATLLYTADGFHFKGDIIIDTPTEFTSTREKILSIAVKGRLTK